MREASKPTSVPKVEAGTLGKAGANQSYASKRSRGSAPALSWKDWDGPRECSTCKRKLTLEDVGEFRSYYTNGKVTRRFLWCVNHRGGRNA